MSPPRRVAFLRAINVGGHTVTMQTLRDLFERQGLTDVETFIASGNVIFRSRARDLAGLERKIERRLTAALGYEVKTFLRTGTELARITAHRPFTDARVRNARAFNVGFLAAPPGRTATEALLALRTAGDDFHVRGREVYWLSRARLSGSKFSYAVLERTLGGQATFRGMNTITRLVAAYGFGEAS